MKSIFTEFLFSKHLLVNTSGKKEHAFEALFSLANLFNIHIVSGHQLANPDMISTAEYCIGREVPLPFYQGFPQSVRELSPDQLLFDQLAHYFVTYTCGDFSEAGHSLFEENFERTAFKEKAEIKHFTIITEEEAVVRLAAAVADLLASTRPLSESHYNLVRDYVMEYNAEIPNCASKDTAVQLLLDTRDLRFAAFLQLSDVIRILDYLNYETYGKENLKRLNLRNQDRKFLTGVMNTIFQEGQVNIADCFEKKKIWNGFLHHIHYKPINETAQNFVDGIRGKENLSVYSTFEKQMQAGEIREAVRVLRQGKGSGALLRKLTYILSRCKTEEDVSFVLKNLKTANPIILLQLIQDYSEEAKIVERRTFQFTKYRLLRVHKESLEEYSKRKSLVSKKIRQTVAHKLWENLAEIYRGRLGKVYIAPGMERMGIPLQETTASGGFGVLPKGSRVFIRAGQKIRCFTYWERVDDIDLSVFALTKDNKQLEFSWRNMRDRQSSFITYSGDETSGYYGGSEYFDVDLDGFMQAYPMAEYLIFCNNVYSGSPFSKCVCTAGYMDRALLDSGEIFEPKTVATSFKITANSTFAYLFGVDLAKRELVWLNISRDSGTQVAGTTSMDFLRKYFKASALINVRKIFAMMATEVVNTPEEADVVVTDKVVSVGEGVEVIHSYDTERILALMN